MKRSCAALAVFSRRPPETASTALVGALGLTSNSNTRHLEDSSLFAFALRPRPL